MAAMTIRHDGGDRFVARVRDHELVFDQPSSDGGADSGPSPTETFVAALAACVAFNARRYLSRHGLPEGVTVTASFAFAHDRPHRVGTIDLRVDLPATLPAKRAPGFSRVVEACTLHRTLEHPPGMTITVVEP